MTREKLIKSDEYVSATVECIVVSKKSVKKIRSELNKFFLGLRDELLSLPVKEKCEKCGMDKTVVKYGCSCEMEDDD